MICIWTKRKLLIWFRRSGYCQKARQFTGDWWIPLTEPVTRKMFPFDDVIMKLLLNKQCLRDVDRWVTLSICTVLFSVALSLMKIARHVSGLAARSCPGWYVSVNFEGSDLISAGFVSCRVSSKGVSGSLNRSRLVLFETRGKAITR